MNGEQFQNTVLYKLGKIEGTLKAIKEDVGEQKTLCTVTRRELGEKVQKLEIANGYRKGKDFVIGLIGGGVVVGAKQLFTTLVGK